MADLFTLDIPQFRIEYPEFADIVEYPDFRITQAWDMATCSIPPIQNYGALSGSCRYTAIQLLTAHMLKTDENYKESFNSDVGTIVNNAREDLIDVGVKDIPTSNNWEYTLSTTVYGRKYIFILSSKAMGGFLGGGRPVRAPFLK